MSKKRNQDLILKTLKKMYKGTNVETLVKDAKLLSEIAPQDIEESKTAYPLTDNLVNYYIRETMKQEKVSRIYRFFNFEKIEYTICMKYIAEVASEGSRQSSYSPEERIKKFKEKKWQEDDLQLDTCKGPGYLRPKGFNYK